MNLYMNHIHGSIPSEIGGMKALTTFQIYGNQLSGNIPAELGTLDKVSELPANTVAQIDTSSF